MKKKIAIVAALCSLLAASCAWANPWTASVDENGRKIGQWKMRVSDQESLTPSYSVCFQYFNLFDFATIEANGTSFGPVKRPYLIRVDRSARTCVEERTQNFTDGAKQVCFTVVAARNYDDVTDLYGFSGKIVYSNGDMTPFVALWNEDGKGRMMLNRTLPGVTSSEQLSESQSLRSAD